MKTVVSTPEAPIQVAQLGCNSFDEFAEATAGWDLDWRQLDRGSLSAKLLQVSMPSMLVTQFLFSRKFHQRGTSPPGLRSFGIVGARSTPVEWSGRETKRYQIEVFPATDEYDCVSHPGFRGDGVSISEDSIRSVAETLGLPDPLERTHEGPCFVDLDPRRMEELRGSLAGMFTAVVQQAGNPVSEAACSDLEFEITSALVHALATSFEIDSRSPSPTVRSRALRLALDYIEDSAEHAPPITDVCRASGASYRTLNYAFHERFGMAPKQYLHATRLNRVRGDLRRQEPNVSIIDIANRSGFWHMGQFAADYRRMFNELPSETRRPFM